MTGFESRLIKLTMRSWPESYRTQNGDELHDTAFGLSSDRGSNLALIREAASLHLAGWQARFRAATTAGLGATWTSALRFALFASIIAAMAEILHLIFRGPAWSGDPDNFYPMMMTGLVLAGGAGLGILYVSARPAAAVGVIWAAAGWFIGPMPQSRELALFLGLHLGAAALLAWRNSPTPPRATAWAIATTGGAIALALSVIDFEFRIDAVMVWAMLAAAGLAKWDPRPLAGLVLFWLMRLVIFVPALIADDLWASGNSWFYSVAAAVAALGLLWVNRSVNRSQAI